MSWISQCRRLSAYHSLFLLKADEQTEEGPEGLTMTVEDIGTSEIHGTDYE